MKRIRFAPETTGFYKELKENINQYFITNKKSKVGGRVILVKVFFLLLVYVLSYGSIYYFNDVNYTQNT